MSEWKTYKLEDAIEKLIDYRGKTPSKTSSGIPLVTAKVIKNGRIEKPNEFIAEEDYESWMRRGMPKYGDVVLTTEAPLGEVAQILTYEKIALAQRVITLRGKDGLLNNSFLKYFLISPIGQNNLKAKETGSTVTGIKQSELRKVEIQAPDLATQTQIAQILSALDDKIELNLQMNQTLEAMAQAIFKEWFVNFNFPGFDGELVNGLPKGWRMGKLGECITIKRGGSPRPIQEFIAETGLRWLKISDVTSLQTPYILETKEYIKKEGLSKTTLLKAGRLVLSNSATPGIPKILNVDSCIHDGWLHFPESMFSNEFLYLKFLELRRELVQKANGSIFTNLKTEIVRDFDIIIPDNNILIAFDNVIKPIFEKLLQNTLQIKALTQTRDTLLPKLMSGQIEVAI